MDDQLLNYPKSVYRFKKYRFFLINICFGPHNNIEFSDHVIHPGIHYSDNEKERKHEQHLSWYIQLSLTMHAPIKVTISTG